MASSGFAWWLGAKSQSPAQVAAQAAGPTPSWITAIVEARVLSETIIHRGIVSPQRSSSVGVPVSVEGEAVITQLSKVAGDEIAEGDKLVEVSGRPVFVMQGEVPVFRTLRPGMDGADVIQLQSALSRLGYEVELDGVFGPATKVAVTSFYSAAGYDPVPTSSIATDDIAAANLAVSLAQGDVNEAESALATAGQGQPNSVIARLAAERDSAQRALANATAQRSTDLSVAQTGLDQARTMLSSLEKNPDAVPSDLDAARLSVSQTEAAFTTADRSTQATIDDAADSVRVTQIEYDESSIPGDTGPAQAALATAVATRDASVVALDQLVAANGPTIAQGEIIFVPATPARVETIAATLGPIDATAGSAPVGDDPVPGNGSLATLSTGELIVSTMLPQAELELVRRGTEVELLDETTNTNYVAAVESVDETSTVGADGSVGYVASITPTAPLPPALSGANLRVTIRSASTVISSLVVPVTAVTTDADGVTRVSILQTGAAEPSVVAVNVEMSAGGFVAVKPIDPDSLSAGDRVVVGR